ncbi:putative protein phosphatase 2C 40 [Glycine max]|nr:putative protein phosphatase 2C 40 [Glycine max]
MLNSEGELKISFGYKCNRDRGIPCEVVSGCKILPGVCRTSSFSCLSGAALSANATLANTNICNGKIGEEILPSWDSPTSFRKVTSSPSLSKLDILSSSPPNSLSYLSCSPSTVSDILEYDSCTLKSMSDPSRSEGFLNAKEVQVAGGAAGEDRVQAVCSEENGWLFCAIYDGFNGRDAADFLAGDSRAVLATCGTADRMDKSERLKAIQLTDNHTVDNKVERARLLADHPDDPKIVIAGKVKGKLKVTRAFGVGYLKKKSLNDALMGILRVHDLKSPPYISTNPSLNVHRISNSDQFVIVGSDGLFDFFSNDEAVKLVESYILNNPFGDPAKFLIEQLVARAADSAGLSMEELMNIPAGRRRKYHDDVTVIVIMLGMNQRTSKASTCI